MSPHDVESQNGSHANGQKLSDPLLSSSTDVDHEVVGFTSCRQRVLGFVVDVVASIPFWYVINFWFNLPNVPYYSIWVAVLAVAAVWRMIQPRRSVLVNDKLPYPIGYFVDADGRELYIVATVHISPKSALDAKDVIQEVKPDVVMIELDEERLDLMRPKQPEPPKQDDLQHLELSGLGVKEVMGQDRVSISGQRAIWNGEKRGELIRGGLYHDVNDPHGLQPASEAARGKFLIVHRGPQTATPGLSATFVAKAHKAARGGAVGVVVVSNTDELPGRRLGVMSGALVQEVKLAIHTRSFGFPPIPLVMITATDGEKLIRLISTSNQTSPPQLECKVMADDYPRRTLRRSLCQTCMLYSSGIGILYGIVRCFRVEVGGEFVAAEETASEQGVPCVCIDFDMNRLWSRLLKVTKPTPSNILRIVWSWLAAARCILRMLFPLSESVDNLGSMVLHAKSFPLRNWFAFVIAGFGASTVSSTLLNALSAGAADAAVDVKAVDKSSSGDFQVWLLNVAMMYLLPCLYEAILASRDEAMYRGICSKARSLGAKRMVAVTGAAHTNGILQRCRERGLV